MAIRHHIALWTICVVAPIGVHQSAINNPAINNPAISESAISESAIRDSAVNSAVRSPQSALKWRQLTEADWRGYKGGPVPAGWRFENGTLAKEAPVADLVSKDEF